MASVWYVGRADTRTISPTEWIAAGTFGALFTWGEENGYSIPMGEFSPEQIAVMDTDDDFSINAPSGPRPDPRDPYDIQLVLNTAQVEEFILSELQNPGSAISNLLREIDAIQDINDPLTAAMIEALSHKAPLTGAALVGPSLSSPTIDSPTFTGTPTGLTKAAVGLPNVDDTNDQQKPVSILQAAALGAKADLVGGVIPTSQIPSVSLTTAVVVGTQAAMLALTSAQVQPGDIAIRTDGAGTFILQATPASTLANWALLRTPTDVVVSVNGLTGAVTLGKSNIGLPLVDNTADVDKPISNAQAAVNATKADATLTATALNLKADLAAGKVPLSQVPDNIPVNGLTTAAIAAAKAEAIAAGSGGGGGGGGVQYGAVVKNWANNPLGLGPTTFINDPNGNATTTPTISATGGTLGAEAHKVSGFSSSSHGGVITPVDERFPVVEGQKVTVGADVINPNAASRAFWIAIRFFAADKTTAVGSGIVSADVTIGPGGSQWIDISMIAPAGAYYAAFNSRRQSGTGSSSADTYYLDRLFYGVNIPDGFLPGGFFSGNSVTDANFKYESVGTLNNSPSTRTEIIQAQSSAFNRRLASATAAANNTALTQTGVQLATIGTATAISPALTNAHTAQRRLEYLITSAATSAIAGYRTNGAPFLFQGDGSLVGMGGYRLATRWGPATGVTVATQRAFAGVQGGITTPTDVEPSSRTNIVGMGWDAADTNVQMMFNDASGTATKVDLGVGFPVPNADRAFMYDLELQFPANGTTVIWKVTNLVTGAVATGTQSTDLPAGNVLMSPMAAVSAGGTSSVQGLALASVYIDLPN